MLLAVSKASETTLRSTKAHSKVSVAVPDGSQGDSQKHRHAFQSVFAHPQAQARRQLQAPKRILKRPLLFPSLLRRPLEAPKGILTYPGLFPGVLKTTLRST